MSLNLNLSAGLSQQQQLNLAPQLLQWLRLLQVSAQDLNQLVQHEVETNPALEVDEGQEMDFEDASDSPDDLMEIVDPQQQEQEDWPDLDERFETLAELDSDWASEHADVSGSDQVAAQEKSDYQMQSLTAGPSLSESLLRQLSIMDATPEAKAGAQFIVGMLDQRGYLDVSLGTLCDESGFCMDDLVCGLECVQRCDPAGIGARDLQECLRLQLSEADPADAVAIQIVDRYLEALARGQMDGIAKQLAVTREEVEAAQKRIRSLNPHPGSLFDHSARAQVITPDVTIRLNSEGGFDIDVVEHSLPRLRISRSCRALIQKGRLTKSEAAYIRSKVRAASFLIEGLEKRSSTLRRVAEEIVRVQGRYLKKMENEVRPLTMAKVAGIIGVHDTTVSRALAEKYVATPRGVLPMKNFFCTGYRCDDGSAMTPEMVRRRIEGIILRESPASPIKDEDIAAELKSAGIPVARRTIAKYRGELGIPSSKERYVKTANRGLRVLPGGKLKDELSEPQPALALG